MIIDCISDLHGEFPALEGGDLLIMAGDCTTNDTVPAWCNFFEWFARQQYTHKILVAGNHDGFLASCISTKESRELLRDHYEEAGYEYLLASEFITKNHPPNSIAKSLVGMGADDFSYLLDDSDTIDELKIWGSPWTPEFYDWHFMKKRGEELREVWRKIPEDTDILVTHGPPFGILDKNAMGEPCGCEELAKAVERIKPKLHVFGHIHGGYGRMERTWADGSKTIFVNAAHMDEDYEPENEPIRVIL